MAYIVDKEGLVKDFVELEEQEKIELSKAIADIEVKVDEKITKLRPSIYDETKKELEAPVIEKFNLKKEFLSKYVSVEEDNAGE